MCGNGALYMAEEKRKQKIRNFFEYLLLSAMGLFLALVIIGITINIGGIK